MRSFGDQTLTFVAITDGALDRLGIPTQVRTEVVVTGCRFRPLNFEETVNLTNLSTEVWKGTVPPHPAVLSAKAIDEVKHNGDTYQIVGGIKPYTSYGSNQVYKVTVMCQKQVG
jgi:hypothetical protein